MRDVLFFIKIIIIAILGIAAQLILHEAGHMLVAVLTGNTINAASFAITSFTSIKINNAWSISYISLGAFVLPLFICAVFSAVKNKYVVLFTSIVLTATAIQLVMNAWAVLFVNGKELSKYDLGLYMANTGHNPIAISCIAIIVTFLLIAWLGLKVREFINMYVEET